jgi:hypothetical protein
LKAEALTSLAEADGLGKVRAAIKAATALVLEILCLKVPTEPCHVDK